MWLKHYKNYTYAVRYNMIEFVIGDSLQPDPHFSWEIPPSANQLVASNIFQAFYYVDHRREIPYLCCRQRFEIKLYDLIVLVEPLGEHYLNLWPTFLIIFAMHSCKNSLGPAFSLIKILLKPLTEIRKCDWYFINLQPSRFQTEIRFLINMNQMLYLFQGPSIKITIQLRRL